MPSYKTLAELRLDFLGLLVLPRGRILKVATTMISPENWDADMHDDLGVWPIDMPFAAVGTGTEIAIGAMAAGANVVAAVRIAARYDMNSRLPVHSLPLKPGGKV